MELVSEAVGLDVAAMGDTHKMADVLAASEFDFDFDFGFGFGF